MKILCLHGNGTNSEVLQLQSAPIRHELEEQHEYEFVEGASPVPLSTVVQGLDVLSQPDSQFYAFYNPDDMTTLHRVISQLDSYAVAEGPFDAILGFSAGAVLAAMYMATKQLQAEQIPVKCAIFVASAASVDERAYLGIDQQQPGLGCISIPTAHIWGANDDTAPTGGRDTSLMFDPSLRATLVHDGGHEFPRKHFLTEAAQVIHRTLQRGREHV